MESSKIVALDSTNYKLKRMNALLQMKIVKRLTPLVSALVIQDEFALQRICSQLSQLSDGDLEFITEHCLQHTERLNSEGHPFPLIHNGKPVDTVDISLCVKIIKEHMEFNFGDFFVSVQQLFNQPEDTQSDGNQ